MQPASPIAPFTNAHSLFETTRACMCAFNNNPTKENLTAYRNSARTSGEDLSAKKRLVTNKTLFEKIDLLYLLWRGLFDTLGEIEKSENLVKCKKQNDKILTDTWVKVNIQCHVIKDLANAILKEGAPLATENSPLLSINDKAPRRT